MSQNIASVHYSNTYIGDIKQKLLNDLHSHIERDKTLGFTSTDQKEGMEAFLEKRPARFQGK